MCRITIALSWRSHCRHRCVVPNDEQIIGADRPRWARDTQACGGWASEFVLQKIDAFCILLPCRRVLQEVGSRDSHSRLLTMLMARFGSAHFPGMHFTITSCDKVIRENVNDLFDKIHCR